MTRAIIEYQDQQSMLPHNSTDESLIALWFSLKHSPNTKVAYSVDMKAFLAFVGKPLQTLLVNDTKSAMWQGDRKGSLLLYTDE
jgi:hypothetical protein